jgi:hypothetical protein
MQFTNKCHIPSEIVSAIVRDPYYHDGRISVTALINSPRIHQLQKRHAKEIVQDVSERLFSLYGQIAHGILERADDFEAFHEERLSIHINDWKVTGATDLYKHRGNGEYLLRDYKFTSVYVSNFDLKPEWSAQVNLYAHLWRHHSFEVHRAQIVAIYGDWRRMEAERREIYPPPVQLFNVPLWSDAEAMQYLTGRVRLHQEAEALPADRLPLCSPDEQWRREEKWAVMKTGRKTAVRLFNSRIEADMTAVGIKGSYLEHRPAEPIRCKYFCSVNEFCNQYAEEQVSGNGS